MFKRVTIIGLGLIGGSLGQAIKKQRLAKKIIGVSRKASTIRKAKAIGAVDVATRDIKKGVKDSDLIILTAPVLTITKLAKSISGHLKDGAVVTDTGSTKKYIVKRIESVLPSGRDFVGSHPIAGSEKSGVGFADKDLFKGAYCILTKTKRTNKKALKKIKKFWNRLGMKVKITSAECHDKVISKLSHLPHALAVSLCNASNKKELHLAAGGFKDTTRIASGNPELWKDIFVTNRKNIVKDMKVFRKELLKIENALERNDSAKLLRLLKKAKTVRDSLS